MLAGNKASSRRSKDWRQFNPVAAPDRGFVKQLKKLDPLFEVVWDAGSSKWEIWKVPEYGEPYHIMTVETKDKSYRQLGADILLTMQLIVKRRDEQFDIAGYLLEMDRQERRRKEKVMRNKIEAITLDSFNYMRGVLQVQVPAKIELPNGLAIGEVVRNE